MGEGLDDSRPHFFTSLGDTMTYYLGCDPGLSGAICVLSPESGMARFWDIPTVTIVKSIKKKRRVVDIAELWRIICSIKTTYGTDIKTVTLENVHAMPHEGVTSAFSFGRTFGIIEALLIAASLEPKKVEAAVWKRKFGLLMPKETAKATKKATSIAKFVELSGCPSDVLIPKGHRVPSDGYADSALIAIYGFLSEKNI